MDNYDQYPYWGVIVQHDAAEKGALEPRSDDGYNVDLDN